MYSILYVDDEEALLEIGKLFLEGDGTMTVESVTSAPAALDRIGSVPFDAIISDYQMPDMDGIEFLKAVRSRFSDLPFILFTGRGREQVVIQAINNGADFYLQKGGDPSSQFAELAHKVRMAIERRRATQALQRETIFTQAIFDSVPGILYLYDSDGRLVRWNKNHETITGYSAAELAGRYVLDWFPDEANKQIIRDKVDLAMREGQATEEANLVTRSGACISFLFTARRLEIGGKLYFTGVGIDITEWRKAKEALHASEEKFRGISERSSDLIYIEDKTGVITYVSPSMERILGYTPGEVIGMSGDLFVLDEDLPKIQSGRAFKQEGGSFENFEIRVKRKDGSPVVLDLQAIPIIKNGEFFGLQVIGRDVTERKKAEQALEESEKLYHTLADCLPDFIVVHRGGTILYANRLTAEITGIAQEDLVGHSIFEFIAPESQDIVFEKMRQREEGKPTEWYEVIVRVRGGMTKTALVNSAEIPYRGSPAVLLVMSDISARKQLEDSLQESEERFRLLTEHSLDTIMLFDKELRHLYVNPAVVKGLGIPPAEFIGKTHREMAFPDHLVRLWEDTLRGVFDSGNPAEVQFQLPNGIWADWLLVPVHGPDGFVDQVLASARIITKLKLTEQTLRRANRQISLLNAITRHDILNQISVIQAFLTLAAKKPSDPDQEGYFRKLKSAAEMIREQIGFTRIYGDIGSRDPSWQDVAAVLAQQPVPEGITLAVDMPRVEIFADPMLGKVFFNLLDNAARHGGSVSEVRVSAQEGPDGYVIKVEDNGCGIARDEKEKIFERGFGKNTGLGLFLVREILAITGITIHETGTAGSGARFEIIVPREAYRFTNQAV
ncbi:MAG: PAS domain S-box protein [Methanoregula sp.]